jgi:Cu2+-exporting ATPase
VHRAVRDERCFHCAEALSGRPATRSIEGTQRHFCCEGCAAAAAWIEDAELGDYYRLRSAAAARVGVEPEDFSAWDRDDLLAEHARAIDGGREITVLTDAMRCAACAWLIDRALQREPGVLDAGANAVTGRIRIAWDPARTRLSLLLASLAALGYRTALATGEVHERQRRRERRRWLLRLGVAGLGAMQAMMFAEALYLDTAQQMPEPTRDFFRWLAFLVSTPVVFFSGWPFLAGMARELRQRRIGMDTLVAGSTLLAYFASLVETMRGGSHVWYDAAVMFVFLLLAARMLEQRARSAATAQVDALARARPALAVREAADGTREQVPLAALAPGDIVRVVAGDAVPADGVLLDGRAAFDESLLTGESAPVAKDDGDAVYAGSLCRDAPARVRLTHTGTQTRLSELTRLVEHAQAQRPPLARLADRVASWFAVALLLAAALVFAWWHVHAPARAFEIALAVLVVSCPCALSLAVPAALAAAHGALARMGVLALRPDALDTLARAQRVVFDKTGTLGDGRPELEQVQVFGSLPEAVALTIAAALERDSGHPLARAFDHAGGGVEAQDVRSIAGCGIEGMAAGRRWRLGRADWAAARMDDGALWLGDGAEAHARFVLREVPRADAATAVAQLRQAGLAITLCSGDAPMPVAALARRVGIEDVHARQSPEAKLAFVQQCQARGEVVAMVGDGINDAPVLAGADVSLAMADGAALAQRAADLVVTGTSLQRIPQALALARRTRRIVRQNLAWAVGYNLLALPLAASGAITPWIAALGMAASSLLVTANALRLVRAPGAATDDPFARQAYSRVEPAR